MTFKYVRSLTTLLLVASCNPAVAGFDHGERVERTLGACVPTLSKAKVSRVRDRMLASADSNLDEAMPVQLGRRAGLVLSNELEDQAAGRAPNGERWREFMTLWLMAQRTARSTVTAADRVAVSRGVASKAGLSFAIVECGAAVVNLQHAVLGGSTSISMSAIFGLSALAYGFTGGVYPLYLKRTDPEKAKLLPGTVAYAERQAIREKAEWFVVGAALELDQRPEWKLRPHWSRSGWRRDEGRDLLELVQLTWPPLVTANACEMLLAAPIIED